MDPIAFSRFTSPALIPTPRVDAQADPAPGSFAGILRDAVGRVQQLQTDADHQVRRMLAGEPLELHRVMLAGESAAVATGLMMAVRNKVVDAYQEIMRMQI